jgi:hypothetical protein
VDESEDEDEDEEENEEWRRQVTFATDKKILHEFTGHSIPGTSVIAGPL